MCHTDNVIDIRRPVEFSINERTYVTTRRRQRAVDLLILAGVDPSQFTLTELRVRRLHPLRYGHGDVVDIRNGSHFVAVRGSA